MVIHKKVNTTSFSKELTMRHFAYLLVSAAMLIAGVSVFADKATHGIGPAQVPFTSVQVPVDEDQPVVNNRGNVTPVDRDMVQPVTVVMDWVGKTSVQLVQQLGNPDSIYFSATGVQTYDYNRSSVMRGRNNTVVTTRLEFDVDSMGYIMDAKSSVL
jgi:hypothetical protein